MMLKEMTEVELRTSLDDLSPMIIELERMYKLSKGEEEDPYRAVIVRTGLERAYNERQDILNELRSRGPTYSVLIECAHAHTDLECAIECANRNAVFFPESSFIVVRCENGAFHSLTEEERAKVTLEDWITLGERIDAKSGKEEPE